MSLPPLLKGTAGRFPVRRQSIGRVPVAIIKNPAAPSASVAFCFKDGVAYEPEDLWGAAHFLEHAVFRGTERHPALYDVSRSVERFGGRVSAYSTRDMTAFWVKTPPGHEDASLELLVELLARPALKAESIESERSIIRHEQ
ncbi:MAG: insulinase family protein, partial [Elusimicrobia bacterium]|nr:insulinase family protein [Elusimicrobiota bacterium]